MEDGLNVPQTAEEKTDLLLSLARSATALQLIFESLSDIEGGIRTLDQGDGSVDQASVRRIRQACKVIDTWIPRISEDFAMFAGWVASGGTGEVDFRAKNAFLKKLDFRKRKR